MGDLLKLENFKYLWHEVATIDNDTSTLQVYVNKASGELEFVQQNDEGEAIRTVVSVGDSVELLHNIHAVLRVLGKV